MTPQNYESKWWGSIYDQMMEEMPDLMDDLGRICNHSATISNLQQL